jgi:hypothetical protein
MNKENKLKKNNHFRVLVFFLLKKMLKWWKTSLFILGVIALSIYMICNSFYKNYVATTACENMYTTKVEKFSENTGITADNIEFSTPIIKKSKNLYSVIWNDNIDIGGLTDSFTCQYNFATKRTLDRTE